MARKNAKRDGEESSSELDGTEDFNASQGQAPLKGDHEKNAYENGIPASDYAQRLLQSQGVTEPATVKVGNIERGMRRQGYPLNDIREAIEPIYRALMSAEGEHFSEED